MDIRDQIKERFKGKKPLTEASRSKWDPETQPNDYALDEFLHKAGYRLTDISNYDSSPELLIDPIRKGYLHPEIIHDVTDKTFYVDVKKYGMLNSSDLEEIVKGYTTALGVLEYLDSLDLSKLEVEEGDD